MEKLNLLLKSKIDDIKDVIFLAKKEYDELKKIKNLADFSTNIQNGNLILPENFLIHGTNIDDINLKSIKKDGIIAKEFSKQYCGRFNEMQFMASFFRNATNQKMTVPEALNCDSMPYLYRFLPKEKYQSDEKKNVCFILNTNDKNVCDYMTKNDLIAQDHYSKMWELITDETFFYEFEKRRKMAEYSGKLAECDIPLGIPFNCICGIIVDSLLEDFYPEKMKNIYELFGKDLFIVSSNGKVLSSPKLINEQNLQKTY